ncbi:MAG TPA: insulinase family protein [Phycisphaerales bacterium]|nr:insulinase family protein [Phycisphaerales bacterium]
MSLVKMLVMAACLASSVTTIARAQVVPPPVETPDKPARGEENWLIPMDQRPAFGEWKTMDQIQTASVWTGLLGNGVRVSWKYFPVEKQTAQIQVALYGGGLQEDATTRGLTEAAVQAWTTAALTDMSHAELKSRLKGWNVGSLGEVAGDFARLTVAGDNIHLELQFQLAYLLLTKPRVEPAAIETWKQQQLREIEGRMRGTRAAFPHVMAEALFPAADPRGRALTREQVDAITVEKAQAWLEQLIKTAPIEISVVGRVPKDNVFDNAQRYFAGLAPRPEVTRQTNAQLRVIPKADHTVRIDRQMPSSNGRAVVSWGFWACDEYDYERVLPLQLAARIATRRFDATISKLLPERGNRGGVSWALNPGSTFPGMGMLVGVATAPPGRADEFHERMLTEIRELAETGPTQIEMEEALPALREQWRDRLTDMGGWAMLLESLAYTGVDPAQVLLVPDKVLEVTPEQVRDALRTVVQSEPATSIVLRPLQAGAVQQPAPQQPAGN